MKWKRVVPLAVLIGLAGCAVEEEQVSSSDADTATVSSRLAIPERIRPCNTEPEPEIIEQALAGLYTEAGRARVVQAVVDRLGFHGWVEATGGMLFGCTGDSVPLKKERITAAINHLLSVQRAYNALELTEDAGYATHDWKTFSPRAVALQGARNVRLSPSERVDLYETATEYGPHSFEENVVLAEEIASYLGSQGASPAAKRLVEKLLPDTVDYRYEYERLENITIPTAIKATRESLVAELNVRNTSSSPSTQRPLRKDKDRCETYLRESEKGIRVAFQLVYQECHGNSTSLFQWYEKLGAFDEARELAKGLGLNAKMEPYYVAEGLIRRPISNSFR